MPKNVKVLLFVMMAVNTMADVDVKSIERDLNFRAKSLEILHREGLVRIEQKGQSLQAYVCTEANDVVKLFLRKAQKDVYYEVFADCAVYPKTQHEDLWKDFVVFDKSLPVLYDDEVSSVN